MPTISMFRGIKISMYWNDHMPPHFHATYGGEELNSMRNVGYYLAKGLDRKTAEYFAEGRKRIVHVVPNDNFTLVISFDNGEKRLYDVAPLLQAGTVFAPVSPALFFVLDITPRWSYSIDNQLVTSKRRGSSREAVQR